MLVPNESDRIQGCGGHLPFKFIQEMQYLQGQELSARHDKLTTIDTDAARVDELFVFNRRVGDYTGDPTVNEIVYSPATRQLELIHSGQISVAELAEAHIRQIERLNPLLNALVDFDAERVRAQARQLDATREPRGPLHGLPVTVKSSIATAGYRCEIGSTLHKGDIPKEDAVVVARLRAAGALILGTTNCPEFLMAYETANLLHGRTLNPWDFERSPGGSSGGESAAIAA